MVLSYEKNRFKDEIIFSREDGKSESPKDGKSGSSLRSHLPITRLLISTSGLPKPNRIHLYVLKPIGGKQDIKENNYSCASCKQDIEKLLGKSATSN
ncbi:MAG TPA: hypothetical protein DIT07_09665 [Sphingobacteriaceae bacterium]|nr:hypothetical protein [Sphingobacteriaceae bacterium]